MEDGRNAGTEDGSRVHVALEVADLARSIRFYETLLGAPAVKLRPGYAKFAPREPAVNLTLNEGAGGRLGREGGPQHFGIEVRSSAAVDEAAQRLRRAGIETRVEEGVSCCYAVQDKVWASDPDGNPWEVFVVLSAEAPERRPGRGPERDLERDPEAGTCCAPAATGGASPGGLSCCEGP